MFKFTIFLFSSSFIIFLSFVVAVDKKNTSKTNITSQPTSICEIPLPPVEPEMCCDFPTIFEDSVVQKCELDFASVEKKAGELVTDSVRNFYY